MTRASDAMDRGHPRPTTNRTEPAPGQALQPAIGGEGAGRVSRRLRTGRRRLAELPRARPSTASSPIEPGATASKSARPPSTPTHTSSTHRRARPARPRAARPFLGATHRHVPSPDSRMPTKPRSPPSSTVASKSNSAELAQAVSHVIFSIPSSMCSLHGPTSMIVMPFD